jgi:hypothetical protein
LPAPLDHITEIVAPTSFGFRGLKMEAVWPGGRPVQTGFPARGDVAHGRSLTEYLIGMKALGRLSNFSPLEDSSVRTRAYELRQPLQGYYRSENLEAPGLTVQPLSSPPAPN